jgi:hypothetical protein
MQDAWVVARRHEYALQIYSGLTERADQCELGCRSVGHGSAILCLAALASSPSLVPRHPSEPESVLALRRTFGHELAGLPYQDNDS